MNLVLQLLFACPRCWVVLGGTLSSACAVLVLLGWRLGKRVERVEAVSGVQIDLGSIIAALPLPVPVTASGMFLAALGVVGGLVLAAFGRWAAKL